MDLNWDRDGLLISNQGSNSDSAHHTAFYLMMVCLLDRSLINRSEETLMRFSKDGLFTRHPSREPNDFSRDQFTPFLAFNAVFLKNKNDTINNYYKKVIQNNLLFFSTHRSNGEIKPWWDRDVLDPATIGLFLRGKDKKSPFLYLTDIHLLTSVIFRLLYVRNKPSKTADENIQLHLITSKIRHQTLISKIAAYVYFRYRPDNDGGKGWKGSVKDFWIRGGTYFPGIAPVTISAINKVFNF